ncbi:tRNA (adenosine(37)-N6)-threonylcarbamoyltransferase complex dimerization subunit type 1 TsaB [Streptomyces radicis]|uniref:tRNA (Adenosine(37)-N6)-threonylcarbamoyltransferase complex dimerization subunit type 1 TsaB n=1 Tax=Streptomyces radicis TaxID=1750517 RepID=A0A3A9W5J2_9ACTN|nr:tRNA (adenosine(37)-N6)-threonylcarbamoyltransferase complex dimerization subunit type 1 TsaB [Streptomyces radicis]RKN08089.1 tRNA (adenosine(37)-N6)-threonylcarbamoyltransferase complex dimerization subunit type 1 TsaB [Streptomyces radicis]RKN20444.1 tRNA (adenosine(37)-N6)-threonylcarbamoyltransferase complex dimerization subunit type 1 TsaB [Streptomyces radicis]
MLLLALDTATPAVTVALYEAGRDGGAALAASDEIDARRHGELLLPAVDRVLSDAGRGLGEVTGLVVGTGPGPYTGLRVGLVTAEALGAARSIPVHGVGTLDALAYATGLDEPFVVATDARRKEVYWARYADARTRVAGPAVDRPAEIAGEVAGLPAAGAGARLYPEAFTGVREDLPAHVSAVALGALAAERLSAGEPLPGARPQYLRRPDARVPTGYKAVTRT